MVSAVTWHRTTPPHHCSANRRTKYQRTYRPRAPHFVRLRIRARALVPTGLQPPPCYRSCSRLFAKFPYGSALEHRLHHRFSTPLIASPGLPGIVAPSLRDNARYHRQGMRFHSVDVPPLNLITHRQYLSIFTLRSVAYFNQSPRLVSSVSALVSPFKLSNANFHFLVGRSEKCIVQIDIPAVAYRTRARYSAIFFRAFLTARFAVPRTAMLRFPRTFAGCISFTVSPRDATPFPIRSPVNDLCLAYRVPSERTRRYSFSRCV